MNKNYKLNKSYYVVFLFLSIFCVFLIENSSSVNNKITPDNSVLEKLSDVTKKPSLTKDQILSDIDNKISEEFDVPHGLEERVGFWFDIYSKYPSDNKIIHHVDYPWIQYEIFNISEILNQPAKFYWMNVQKADKALNKKMTQIRLKLTSLYKKIKKNKLQVALDKNLLDDEEKKYLEAIQKIPGKLLSNLKDAPNRVRAQTGQKDYFSKGLLIANKYMPHLEKIFVDHNLPAEISRLPLVESSFNEMATSKAGAVGLWQFLNGTGKKFLLINSFIDERRSPLKSTEAAAELLKENYMILGKSWPLAITAYNHGPGGIKKATKLLKTKNIVKIIKYFESSRFSFASENYYSEFLAGLYVEKYASELFGDIEAQDILTVNPYKLTQRLYPTKILKHSGLSEEAFLDLNPDLKKAVKMNIPLPKGLIIYVPPDKITDLIKLSSQKVARNKDI